eukprot:166116_1
MQNENQSQSKVTNDQAREERYITNVNKFIKKKRHRRHESMGAINLTNSRNRRSSIVYGVTDIANTFQETEDPFAPASAHIPVQRKKTLSMEFNEDFISQIIDKTDIEQKQLFERWMVMFSAKSNHNVEFDHEAYTELITNYENKPQIIMAMKQDCYDIPLQEKTYDDVLKSFIAWIVTLKCHHLRCNGKLKLNCFCDATFQLFSYHLILQIIKIKANNDNLIFNMLTQRKLQNSEILSISLISHNLCQILPDTLKTFKYLKSFESHIISW